VSLDLVSFVVVLFGVYVLGGAYLDLHWGGVRLGVAWFVIMDIPGERLVGIKAFLFVSV
jgi:hypothetical protein